MALVQDAGNNLLIRCVLVLILLYIMSIEDVRSKELTVIPVLIFGAAGAALSLLSGGRNIPEMISGGAIGGVLIFISAATGGKLGLGDGLVVMMIGLTLGFSITFILVFASLFLGAVFALFLLVVKKKGRNAEYPYMPFLLITYVGVLTAV